MSFISVLKKVVGIAHGVEQFAAPFVTRAVPGSEVVFAGLDSLFAIIPGGVVKQELINPLPDQGAAKSAAVVAEFDLAIAGVSSLISATGNRLTYDKAAADAAVAAAAAMYNALDRLKSTIKLEAIPAKPLLEGKVAAAVIDVTSHAT